MTKISEPITFFGSGPVAAESLRRLAQHGTVECVITKPRPAHHKGPVPVLEVAAQLGLPTLTVESRQTLDELFQTRPPRSRIAVLIDFGIIVSQEVIDYFPLGIVNSHFSLLPQWRGADPITFALLSGQPQTGVSLMLLVAKMDEGPLLAQSVYDITPSETNMSLTEHLIEQSDHLLAQALPDYIEGNLVPYEQTEDSPLGLHLPTSYSRKLSKADAELDFTKPAATLECEIRAFAEWPKSRTRLGEIEVVVTKAHVTEHNEAAPGRIIVDHHDKTIAVTTSDGLLCLDELKPAGKSAMPVAAFLAGYRDRLGL